MPLLRFDRVGTAPQRRAVTTRGRVATHAFCALAFALTVGLASCGSSPRDDVIDREAFIDTYVDLRIAALETDSQRVAQADREAILAEHGVTEEDMVGFVEAYATDLELMRDVWNDVELRLDRTSDPIDDPS